MKLRELVLTTIFIKVILCVSKKKPTERKIETLMITELFEPTPNIRYNNIKTYFLVYNCPVGSNHLPYTLDFIVENSFQSDDRVNTPALTIIRDIERECVSRMGTRLPIELYYKLEALVHMVQLREEVLRFIAYFNIYMRSCKMTLDVINVPEIMNIINPIENPQVQGGIIPNANANANNNQQTEIKKNAVIKISNYFKQDCKSRKRSSQSDYKLTRLLQCALSTNASHRYGMLMIIYLALECVNSSIGPRTYDESHIYSLFRKKGLETSARSIYYTIKEGCQNQIQNSDPNRNYNDLKILVHVMQYVSIAARLNALWDYWRNFECDTEDDDSYSLEVALSNYHLGRNDIEKAVAVDVIVNRLHAKCKPSFFTRMKQFFCFG